MAVIKTHDIHFIDVRRAFALRRDLSLKAKGLLLFLRAVPDHWEFDTDLIHEYLGETEEDITTLMGELTREGYITVTQNEDGTLASNVYDEPQPVEDVQGQDQ